MMRRVGRPGLIGMAARTAVVAGTATAVSGSVARHQQNKANEQYEQQAYEAGLAQFKANNYGTAIQSLQSFLSTYPQSPLAPSAQYWIGNAHYAMRDYKSAIAAQQKVVSGWPESAKAPDALLNIASSQAEAGDANGARNTLRTLVSK